MFHPSQEIRGGTGVALGPSEGRDGGGKVCERGGEGFAEGLSLTTALAGSSRGVDDGPATGLS